ncbi:DMT family transporter [Bowmanella yangjiangensis]|uniref:DMT family transporter n=1 Tax=Bowmanella yangjiangensis TaxID=2811230 RepID=A0ABS3CXK9_9ALTE|nr:DMT family transporter [Bowmanella yangjiangensis]MBN7820846.1 DMT family transporter [Bowmanella yangjiangensis]
MQVREPWLWLMAMTCIFFWGGNFNAAEALAGDVSALTAAAERFLIAAIILLALRLVQNKRESALNQRQIGWLVALGVIGVFGFNYAFFLGLQQTSALNGALIMAASPLVTNILSAWLLNTRITLLSALGIAIGLAGVSLVITGNEWQNLRIAPGDLYMVLACLCMCSFTVLSKKHASQVPPMQLTRWTIVVGTGLLCLFALLIEQPLQQLPTISLKSHLLLIYMGVFGTFVAYACWMKALQGIAPGRLSLCFNFVPVFTLLIGLAMGHYPNAAQLLGMLLVISGVLLGSGFIKRRAAVVRQPAN